MQNVLVKVLTSYSLNSYEAATLSVWTGVTHLSATPCLNSTFKCYNEMMQQRRDAHDVAERCFLFLSKCCTEHLRPAITDTHDLSPYSVKAVACNCVILKRVSASSHARQVLDRKQQMLQLPCPRPVHATFKRTVAKEIVNHVTQEHMPQLRV